MNSVKIKNPEYADSQERMNILRNLVIDGRDAEAVIKYADIFVKECEKAVLDKALKNQDAYEAAAEYRVASKFMEMLRHAADIGKAKEDVMRLKRDI